MDEYESSTGIYWANDGTYSNAAGLFNFLMEAADKGMLTAANGPTVTDVNPDSPMGVALKEYKDSLENLLTVANQERNDHYVNKMADDYGTDRYGVEDSKEFWIMTSRFEITPTYR